MTKVMKIINIQEGLDLNTQVEQQGFPIEVFPTPIQDVINATSAGLQFPIDFSAGAILYAASVGLGNSVKVKVKESWDETACLYLTLVGPPGTNKTHPLAFYVSPIEELDSLSFAAYKQAKSEYDNNLQLSKQEREELGIDHPKKPRWEKMLISDATPEALAECHYHNLRGLGLYTDELASWFKNFDRYHRGSEEQFWLSNWSSKPIRIDRKTGDPIFIKDPFISVGGTIQPAVVRELAKNRTSNGFLDRILFVAPEDLQKEYWGTSQIDPSVKIAWHDILNRILSKKIYVNDAGQLLPEILTFNDSAFQVLTDWQRTNTDLCNSDESLGGVFTKLEIYIIRFCLILHELKKACGEHDNQITPSTVEGAIKIAEYFRATSRRTHALLNASPLDKIPNDKRELYEALPQEFTTQEGIAIADSVGMPQRTFEKFLTKREFFNYVRRGQYEKRFK